jgi:hypothetical protein
MLHVIAPATFYRIALAKGPTVCAGGANDAKFERLFPNQQDLIAEMKHGFNIVDRQMSRVNIPGPRSNTTYAAVIAAEVDTTHR